MCIVNETTASRQKRPLNVAPLLFLVEASGTCPEKAPPRVSSDKIIQVFANILGLFFIRQGTPDSSVVKGIVHRWKHFSQRSLWSNRIHKHLRKIKAVISEPLYPFFHQCITHTTSTLVGTSGKVKSVQGKGGIPPSHFIDKTQHDWLCVFFF